MHHAELHMINYFISEMLLFFHLLTMKKGEFIKRYREYLYTLIKNKLRKDSKTPWKKESVNDSVHAQAMKFGISDNFQ